MAPKGSGVEEPKFQLPLQATGPIEVGRLLRELEFINEEMLQSGLRSGGKAVKIPKTTQLMSQLVEQSALDLGKETDRQQLQHFLQLVRDKAPVVHMSFATDPSPNFTDKIVDWLRREAHPFTLLTIGLQPNIGAGSILRTTNKHFDLSLKQEFADKRGMLLQFLAEPEIEAAR